MGFCTFGRYKIPPNLYTYQLRPLGGILQGAWRKYVVPIDGDLLTNEDKAGLRKLYPFVRFLPTYCLENELYHPDNIAELASSLVSLQSIGSEIDMADDFEAIRRASPKRLGGPWDLGTGLFPILQLHERVDQGLQQARPCSRMHFRCSVEG